MKCSWKPETMESKHETRNMNIYNKIWPIIIYCCRPPKFSYVGSTCYSSCFIANIGIKRSS